MGHLVCDLFATQHGAGAFADADGIAGTVGVEAEDLAAFHQQLVVGDEAGADVDNVDVIDDLLGARDGLEVLALGNDGARDASVVGIGDGAHQDIAGHDRDAKTAHTVGLHGEAALAGHGFDDGLDGGTSLHALIRGQVADVACAHGEDFLTQQGMLLVHHLLEHGGGINAWNVVVLEGRHERHGTCGDHEMLCIDVANLASDDVLDGHATAFKQVPNGVVQQDAFVVVACQGLGDVEATHAAEFLLFFEEEELVGLHVELTTDVGVVVHDDVADAEGVELLTAGETCGTGTDDGDLGLVDFHLAGLLLLGLGKDGVLLVDAAHFLDAIDFGDADTADLAIDQHLAGTAFADTAVEASVAAVERVAVDGITGLVKGGGDGLAALTFDGLAFILEFHKVFLRDVQDGVFLDFVHIECVFES